jgi:hypothetical protein
MSKFLLLAFGKRGGRGVGVYVRCMWWVLGGEGVQRCLCYILWECGAYVFAGHLWESVKVDTDNRLGGVSGKDIWNELCIDKLGSICRKDFLGEGDEICFVFLHFYFCLAHF